MIHTVKVQDGEEKVMQIYACERCHNYDTRENLRGLRFYTYSNSEYDGGCDICRQWGIFLKVRPIAKAKVKLVEEEIWDGYGPEPHNLATTWEVREIIETYQWPYDEEEWE